MKIPYLSFIALYSLIKFCLLSMDYLDCGPKLPEKIHSLKPSAYAEQRFAEGQKVSLSSVDLYDLELIPGVSDRLGQNILEDREKIIQKAKLPNLKKDFSPFEMAHGVGPKKAKMLSNYLLAE